jgi:hypothetical protein
VFPYRKKLVCWKSLLCNHCHFGLSWMKTRNFR